MNHMDDHIEAVFSPLEAAYVAERATHAARLRRSGQMMCWIGLVCGFFGFLFGVAVTR